MVYKKNNMRKINFKKHHDLKIMVFFCFEKLLIIEGVIYY